MPRAPSMRPRAAYVLSVGKDNQQSILEDLKATGFSEAPRR